MCLELQTSSCCRFFEGTGSLWMLPCKVWKGIPDSKSNNFFSTYHLAKVCQIEISNIWQWYEMLMSNHTNYRTIFNFHPLTSTFKKHIDLHQPWRAQNIPPLARNASCNWWMRRPDVFFLMEEMLIVKATLVMVVVLNHWWNQLCVVQPVSVGTLSVFPGVMNLKIPESTVSGNAMRCLMQEGKCIPLCKYVVVYICPMSTIFCMVIVLISSI